MPVGFFFAARRDESACKGAEVGGYSFKMSSHRAPVSGWQQFAAIWIASPCVAIISCSVDKYLGPVMVYWKLYLSRKHLFL